MLGTPYFPPSRPLARRAGCPPDTQTASLGRLPIILEEALVANMKYSSNAVQQVGSPRRPDAFASSSAACVSQPPQPFPSNPYAFGHPGGFGGGAYLNHNFVPHPPNFNGSYQSSFASYRPPIPENPYSRSSSASQRLRAINEKDRACDDQIFGSTQSSQGSTISSLSGAAGTHRCERPNCSQCKENGEY